MEEASTQVRFARTYSIALGLAASSGAIWSTLYLLYFFDSTSASYWELWNHIATSADFGIIGTISWALFLGAPMICLLVIALSITLFVYARRKLPLVRRTLSIGAVLTIGCAALCLLSRSKSTWPCALELEDIQLLRAATLLTAAPILIVSSAYLLSLLAHRHRDRALARV